MAVDNASVRPLEGNRTGENIAIAILLAFLIGGGGTAFVLFSRPGNVGATMAAGSGEMGSTLPNSDLDATPTDNSAIPAGQQMDDVGSVEEVEREMRSTLGSSTHPAELVGTWSEAGIREVRIDADGIWSSAMGAARWKVEGKKIVVSALDGRREVSYPYELSGDRLILVDPERGGTIVVTRVR